MNVFKGFFNETILLMQLKFWFAGFVLFWGYDGLNCVEKFVIKLSSLKLLKLLRKVQLGKLNVPICPSFICYHNSSSFSGFL
jgi:hypothetical protein